MQLSRKWKGKSNKSIKAHPICLQAAWSTGIVHQSNSEADKFWEIGCIVRWMCCLYAARERKHHWSTGLIYSVLLKSESEWEKLHGTAPRMLHTACTELCASLSASMNSSTIRKWTPLLGADGSREFDLTPDSQCVKNSRHVRYKHTAERSCIRNIFIEH